MLEAVDLSTPTAPSRDEIAATVEGWYPTVSPDELERIATLVEAYCRSSLARRVAELDGAHPERSFTFLHDEVLLVGRLDVVHHDRRAGLVLDFKTNLVEGRTTNEIVDDEYASQRAVYALACLLTGLEQVEVVYQFLERPEETVTATFTQADLPALQASLSERIAAIRTGTFTPSPSAFACSGCPALDVVCAGPALGQGEDEPW